MKNEIYGYSLFNDLEDAALQERNRAVVMANIAEHYTKKDKISPKGASMIINYFNEIPVALRDSLYKRFEHIMKVERKYVVE